MKILGPVTVMAQKRQPDNPALVYTERALLYCHTTNRFQL